MNPFIHSIHSDRRLLTIIDGLSHLSIYTVLETSLGIIAASLASLRPLFRCLFDGLRSSRTRRGTNQQPTSTLDHHHGKHFGVQSYAGSGINKSTTIKMRSSPASSAVELLDRSEMRSQESLVEGAKAVRVLGRG